MGSVRSIFKIEGFKDKSVAKFGFKIIFEVVYLHGFKLIIYKKSIKMLALITSGKA